jgi:hypothetical protein
MTEINQLSDKELSEALNFHRRQRNLSRGVNESHHMRQTQMVRMLEAEEARRLEEAEQIDELKKSTLASYVKKASTDQYLKGQAVQYHTNKAQTADGVFAKQSKEKHYDAADKALKKASNRDTGIGRAVNRLAKEEVELSEAETNYVIKHKKTKQVLSTHSDYATAKDEHEGLGADKHEYGVYKQTKKDAALRNRNTYREEADLDEASYRDSGYRNMLKASRKADKEADKMRAQQAKASKPKEMKEETDLRITKVYNKFPKKATYAVHSPDRKYYKEFDSMEKAKAHHAEKTGK